MKLIVLSIEENEKWDNIVSSFADFDVYWLSGYLKAFQIHGDGKPLLFFYEDTYLRGINVVMQRDVAEDIHFKGKLPEKTYYDFSTPYGYGGWLIEGKGSLENLFGLYQKWCLKNGVVCEFVRYHPVISNQTAVKEYYEIVPLGATIAMDLSSPATIWENITSKNRNMLRKAQRSGVQIYNGRSPALFEVFQRIYNSTMDKDKANSYYYFSSEFYHSILNDLPYNAELFYAEQEGEIIAVSLMLLANGRLNYHLSGSDWNFKHLAPTNLLLYEAALWGNAHGCQTMHLGGGVGANEDSLFSFKKSFYRGEACKYYIGKKIFSQESYELLISQRTDYLRNNFFPIYRA